MIRCLADGEPVLRLDGTIEMVQTTVAGVGGLSMTVVATIEDAIGIAEEDARIEEEVVDGQEDVGLMPVLGTVGVMARAVVMLTEATRAGGLTEELVAAEFTQGIADFKDFR